MKIVKKIQLKNVIFTAVKNRCILHGRVFVMGSFSCIPLGEDSELNHHTQGIHSIYIHRAVEN